MANIQPGTGSTVPATTAEGVVFWCLLAIATYESSPIANPDKIYAVQGSLNIKDFAFNITFAFPCVQSADALGRVTFTGVNYLKNVSFTPGNPAGSFKSTSIPAFAVEAIMYLQNLENNRELNPQNFNNIQASYDSEKQQLVGTVKIPCDIYLDAATGTGKFDPREYVI